LPNNLAEIGFFDHYCFRLIGDSSSIEVLAAILAWRTIEVENFSPEGLTGVISF
jgi:hypothetical protein